MPVWCCSSSWCSRSRCRSQVWFRYRPWCSPPEQPSQRGRCHCSFRASLNSALALLLPAELCLPCSSAGGWHSALFCQTEGMRLPGLSAQRGFPQVTPLQGSPAPCGVWSLWTLRGLPLSLLPHPYRLLACVLQFFLPSAFARLTFFNMSPRNKRTKFFLQNIPAPSCHTV